MAVAVGMYLSLKMTVPIFLGGLIKMYVDRRFEAPLKKTNSDLFKSDNISELNSIKEKMHGPGILFASGLIAGEAIMGIGLAAMAVSGIYLGFIDEPSIYPGAAAFIACAALMGFFSLNAAENKSLGKTEEWNFEDNIQDAEIIEEKPKSKKISKKSKKK